MSSFAGMVMSTVDSPAVVPSGFLERSHSDAKPNTFAVNSIWSSAVLGTASLATVALLVAGYTLNVGLRSKSQPTLPLPDRTLIGRYMLAGLAVLLVLAASLSLIPRITQASEESPRNSAPENSVTSPSTST